MSKNTTRKGLALGAAVALVTTGLVSAPAAYAAETLSLAPSAGTTYATVTTSQFTLDAGFAGTESSAAAGTLTFRVTNPAGVSLKVLAERTASYTDDNATAFAYGTTTPSVISSDLVSSSDFTIKHATASTIGVKQAISIEPQAHTADVTVTVQAWLDLNADGDIDSNEATSPVRTVTFYDQANITLGSLTFNDVALGSGTFTVSATTVPELNYQQVDSGDFDVQATLAGTDSGSVAALAYDSTKKDFRSGTVTLGSSAVVDTVKALGAQLELTDGSANKDIGSPVYFGAVSAGKATGIGVPTADTGAFVNGGNLRAGDGTVTLEAVVTVASTTSKVQPVTFVIEEDDVNSLHSGASITVNGTTLKNTSATTKQKISVTVNSVETTETTGTATITVSYAGLKNGNIIDVRAKATSASAILTSSSDLALTGQDSVVTKLVDNVSGALRVVKGSTLSIGYTIVDQFGQAPAPAEGDFRVVISEDSSSAAFSGIQNASNGAVTYTVTENSTANNNYTVTATLQEKVVGGSSYGAIAGGAITETTTVSAVSADTASAITIAAANDGSSTAVTRFLKNTATGDSEIAQSSVSFESYTGTNLSGTVYGANGAPMAGAEVTLSAPGLQFVYSKADAGKVYGAGSITVTADTAGAYTVLVSSNLADEQTITATSGSATKTEVVEFAAAASSTGKSWKIVAPTNVMPGQTFKVSATLVDKYGNPVSVDTGTATDTENIITSYSGPGIVFGTLPDETGADGTLSFSVLLGSTDTGSATVTFGYSANADTDTKDYGDFATSVTITVGAAPVVQKVNAGSFKGYVAVYARGYEGKRLSAKIGNDWVVVPSIVNNQEDGTLFRVTDFTGAGVEISVRIYIDRVLLATIPLTTK